MPSSPDRYIIDSVMKACDVLDAFQTEGELLRMSEIAARAGLTRPTTLRLLCTLERRRLVERGGRHEYRRAIRYMRQRVFRIGYGSHSAEFSFSREVRESLERAARAEGVELLVLDNRYSSRTAIRNAEIFIRERMDLVVEFQADEHHAAPVISAMLIEAGIPLIAIEIPHPASTFFGANNYAAGMIAGRHLGRWARKQWRGKVDEVILLELRLSGPIPASRLTGVLTGIREMLPDIRDSQVVRLSGNGQFGTSLETMRKHLRKTRAHHVLVAAINDPSAIGGLRAFEEIGGADRCAVVGQNASPEARVELRRPGTALIGSVGYFPEKYGDRIIAIAMDILNGKAVPPAVFTRHQLITRENVDHYYPNDAMVLPEHIDAQLLRGH